jgi:hypothetical protein
MPSHLPRSLLALLALLAVLALAAGCSDDGGDEASDEQDASDEASDDGDGDRPSTSAPPTTDAPPPPELTPDEQELADAMQPVLAATLDDELDLPPETATCVSAQLVARFGIDGLSELGVSPDAPELAGGLGGGALPEEQWETYADALLSCFGFGQIFTAGMGAGTDVPGLDPTAEACIDELAASDEWRPAVVEILATGRTADDAVGPRLYYVIVRDCADTEAYVRAMFANGAEPTASSDCQAEVILADPERLEKLITGDDSLFEDPAVSTALAACE